MYKINSLNNFNIYNSMQPVKTSNSAAINTIQSHSATNPIYANNTRTISAQNAINFKSMVIRTSLSSKEETKKYNEISRLIDKSLKKDLQELLKTGKLLNNDSNDKSTTLDNLHKMATSTRLEEACRRCYSNIEKSI